MQLWRHTPRDLAVVLPPLALAAAAPVLPWLSGHGPGGMSLATCLFALVVWWCSNTVAHVHLHTPVFRARALNRLFSLVLTLLTGVPQAVWRARHLAHHRGAAPGRVRLGAQGRLELGLLAHLWLALALVDPAFLLGAYLPGLLLGLGLCQLQGRGEHLGGRDDGISHDGRLYNLVWLNDGYHAEHHRWPGCHWTLLPARRLEGAARSPRAPVVRALLAAAPPAPSAATPAPSAAPPAPSAASPAPSAPSPARPAPAPPVARLLGALERLALAAPPLQRWMIDTHARALARLLPALAACSRGHVPSNMSEAPWRIAVVGGGLFPRTVLALARVWPAARVTVVDADAAHLDRAARELARRGHRGVELVHATWDPAATAGHDLVIVPLALVGDRDAVYTAAGPPRLVHDWLWRRRGAAGTVVAWPLLKRLNLVPGRRE